MTPFVLGGVRETRRRAANDGLTQFGGVSIVLCFCFPLLLCFCLPMPLKIKRSIYLKSFNKSCRPWSTILSCLGLDTRNGYKISSADKSTSTSTFQLRKRRNEPGQAFAVIDCVRFCNLPPDTHLQLPARATSPHIADLLYAQHAQLVTPVAEAEAGAVHQHGVCYRRPTNHYQRSRGGVLHHDTGEVTPQETRTGLPLAQCGSPVTTRCRSLPTDWS